MDRWRQADKADSPSIAFDHPMRRNWSDGCSTKRVGALEAAHVEQSRVVVPAFFAELGAQWDLERGPFEYLELGLPKISLEVSVKSLSARNGTQRLSLEWCTAVSELTCDVTSITGRLRALTLVPFTRMPRTTPFFDIDMVYEQRTGSPATLAVIDYEAATRPVHDIRSLAIVIGRPA